MMRNKVTIFTLTTNSKILFPIFGNNSVNYFIIAKPI